MTLFNTLLASAGGEQNFFAHYIKEPVYLISAALFIFSLMWLGSPRTARKGVYAGVAAMLLAVIATWAALDTFDYFTWIILALVAGFIVGYPLSRVALTAVPQRTALSHAFGGLAAGLVGTAKFWYWFEPETGSPNLTAFRMIAIILEIILGYLTFTGSLIAAGKLMELKWLPQRPWVYKGQQVVNLGAFGLALLLGVLVIMFPDKGWSPWAFGIIILLALNFGWMLVMPIGGADMPTVISILNSYAGLSAVAMGFVLDNKLLIVAGALDGSSGFILSVLMCKAMNRSFTNVLFGAFGQVQTTVATTTQKAVRSASPEDASQLMEMASSVVIVPGYGMAVAQAQHKVRELYDALTKRGIEVRFAIHPVAGRMPGHMNVLLAEADIPYDKLWEMDDINSEFPTVDVVLVIGANDVVNPAARHDKTSPIYGMPILEVDKARTVMAIKRSMNPGFAGIDNELYYMDKTIMVFGDAKGVVGDIVKALTSKLH
ncbi:MAG: NAD(P) transhydrogenase subunit beta [Phycisphaerae bacterium]|nr:NAD(P) transhydrogenase subunit beta [Phycisphaerae bacterium]